MLLNDLITLPKKRPVLITIIIIGFTCTGFLYAKVKVKPVYRAESIIYISQPKIDNNFNDNSSKAGIFYDPLNSYAKHLQISIEFARTRVVAENAAAEMNSEITAGQLRGIVTINPDGESGIVKVTAETSNPDLSQKISNQYSKSIITTSSKIRKVDNISIVSEATKPSMSYNVKPSFYPLLAFFFGIVCSILIAFGMEHLKMNSSKI